VPNQSLAAIRNKRRIVMALQALEIIKSPKITFHFRQLLGIKKSDFWAPSKSPRCIRPKFRH